MYVQALRKDQESKESILTRPMLIFSDSNSHNLFYSIHLLEYIIFMYLQDNILCLDLVTPDPDVILTDNSRKFLGVSGWIRAEQSSMEVEE